MENILKVLDEHIKKQNQEIAWLEYRVCELQKALDAATADNSARGE